MHMSDGEKLIALMLSELYEKLGVRGEIDPEFVKTAIFSDNLWGMSWKYPGIPFEDQEDPEVVKEVIDVLDMWDIIETCYERLSDEDKKFVEEKADPFGKNPRFEGFDGNNEGGHLGVARFIIDDLDRFSRFEKRNLNSHSRSIDVYRRMLPAFNARKMKLIHDGFGAQDIVDVLNEMVHPDNR